MKVEHLNLASLYKDFRFNPAYRLQEAKKIIKWLQNAVKNEILPAKVYVESDDEIYSVVQKFNLFKGDILDEYKSVLMQAGVFQTKMPDGRTAFNPYDGHVIYVDPATIKFPIEFLVTRKDDGNG